VVCDVPKITITGFEEIIIENFIGILEYEEFFVRVRTQLGNVAINGFNLRLTQMNEEDIMVKGKIENISFEK
jgi:sporulation protein YqfC